MRTEIWRRRVPGGILAACLVMAALSGLLLPTAAAGSATVVVSASAGDLQPCAKVYTDPPDVEVGECASKTSSAEPRPCVKVYTDPPDVEVGECAP